VTSNNSNGSNSQYDDDDADETSSLLSGSTFVSLSPEEEADLLREESEIQAG
jgi:nitrogen fixation-related uncharacterized protein